MNDSEQTVREYKDGIKIDVKLKRGTSTRDEDRLQAQVHAEALEEAQEKADAAVSYLEKLAEVTRAIQPGGSEGDDE